MTQHEQGIAAIGFLLGSLFGALMVFLVFMVIQKNKTEKSIDERIDNIQKIIDSKFK